MASISPLDYFNQLSPQAQAELIKGAISCFQTTIVIIGGGTLILLVKFKLRTTKKSANVEKSTTIEFEGGLKKT